MKVDVINLDGKTTGSVDLSPLVFGLPERKDLLHRVVNWQRASWRSGTANSQVRSEVSRVKTKWFRQKGTGRARHGARTANIFVGGAAQFGPRPRDFSFNLPKKVRKLALKTALSVKVASKNLIVIDEATVKSHKTKELADKLEKLNLTHATFVVDHMDANFDKASRNLPHVKVIPTEGANVYDILHKEKLVITENAVKMLETKLQNDAKHAQKGAIPAQKGATKAKPAQQASASKSTAKKTTAKSSTAKKPAAKKTPAKSASASTSAKATAAQGKESK